MAAHDQPIIIKKIKKADHAHHGGAWKIAYADFVTAMMAFFLLLWLISMTTEEQKKGLADYFAPTNVSETESGAGGVLGGTAFDTKGGKTSSATTKEVGVPVNDKDRLASVSSATKNGDAHTSNDGAVRSDSREDLQSKYDQQFASAAASIKQAWQAMPDITKIEDNLLVQQTSDGLDIVIMDQEGRRMFPEGSKYPLELTRKAIAAIAPILQRLPNEISIAGHTAAGGTFSDPSYGSWDLSSDRANVVRSILGEFGLSNDHVHDVSGRATTEPFFPNDPYLAANERVQITVLNGASPVPPGLKP